MTGIFRPVTIPATGQWQLMEMKKLGCYILVHPNGRQAWFHKEDMNRVAATIPQFRYSAVPLNDLKRLGKAGLRPFHVDADFDANALLLN